MIFFLNIFSVFILLFLDRYPDEEAGEIPMAFVVRQPGSKIYKEQVMDFVAKQVFSTRMIIWVILLKI